jgi:hypothetical protein
MQGGENFRSNGDRREQAIQCGICSRDLTERDFPKLYVAEIPGYPLGAARRTIGRVLICKACLKQARNEGSRTRDGLHKLIQWTN